VRRWKIYGCPVCGAGLLSTDTCAKGHPKRRAVGFEVAPLSEVREALTSRAAEEAAKDARDKGYATRAILDAAYTAAFPSTDSEGKS
jgi:hypothetical protein